ncbi:Collagen alpha-6(VI) chain [Varanus komodoensis]|nr:Collagen alpha-6(VI) chain [Varanus komodoensis]
MTEVFKIMHGVKKVEKETFFFFSHNTRTSSHELGHCISGQFRTNKYFFIPCILELKNSLLQEVAMTTNLLWLQRGIEQIHGGEGYQCLLVLMAMHYLQYQRHQLDFQFCKQRERRLEHHQDGWPFSLSIPAFPNLVALRGILQFSEFPSSRAIDWEFWVLQSKHGIPGIPGNQGHQGEDEEPGERGIIGPKGKQGVTGCQGEQGMKGEDGIDGINGINGEEGSQGLPGEKGEKGDSGQMVLF